MQKGKVVNVLRKMDRGHLRRLGQFVHSPYHSRHQDTIRLFDSLVTGAPDFGQTDEELFRAAFPDRPYKNARLRSLRSNLLQLVREFLIQEELALHPPDQRRLLRQAYLRFELPAALDREMATAPTYPDAPPGHQLEDLLHETLHWQMQVDAHIRFQRRGESLPVLSMFRSLDHYRLGTRLKYLCTVVSQSMLIEVDLEDFEVVHWVETAVRALSGDLPDLVRCYCHLLPLLVGRDHRTHYFPITDLLFAHPNRFHRDELRNLYGFLQNHLYRSYYAGMEHSLQLIFPLHENMITADLIFDQGAYSAHTFRNIIVIACRLQKETWAEQFHADQGHRLTGQLGESVFLYTRAYLHMRRRNYTAALQSLQEMHFVDPSYKTGYYQLLLRIYFEKREVEPFYSLVMSFRKYLSRNPQLSQTQKEPIFNFLRLTKALFTLGIKGKAEVGEIRAEIMTGIPLTDKEWLVEKCRELGD